MKKSEYKKSEKLIMKYYEELLVFPYLEHHQTGCANLEEEE